MNEIKSAESKNLVFVCDGTLSSFRAGEETNAGLVCRLMAKIGQSARQRFRYDPGVQGKGWRKWVNAASGRGVNVSILRGYAFLARHYRPGDRIFLFGYSRGAYAVRSLAGMIGKIGLLRSDYAEMRYVNVAFRFYQIGSDTTARHHFSANRCHVDVPIEMLGIWDTVKSLGLPYPVLNRLAPMATDFHDDQLAGHILHGYHALGIDEDRQSFRPMLWQRSPSWEGRLEQAWFPGAHADVGGDVRSNPSARALSNVSLGWMLRRAASHGLILPGNWLDRFPSDPAGPMIGCRTGIARLFMLRQTRQAGVADGETVHLSIRDRMRKVAGYKPRGAIDLPTAEF